MKRIVSILTFAILAVTLSAQNLVSVSGAVYGTANGCNPAPYAKVELLTPDGKIVVNTQCDGEGNYRLQAPAGKYHLHVSFLGYYPTGRDLSLMQDMRLDTIKLFPDGPASVLGVELPATQCRTAWIYTILSTEPVRQPFMPRRATLSTSNPAWAAGASMPAGRVPSSAAAGMMCGTPIW